MKAAMHQRRRKGICAYCGRHGPISKDHVPPLGLFADPKPLNLLTVKACDRCHSQWSKDDEYFRIRLCLNDQARGHPDVNANLPSIFDGLNRPDFAGLKRDLLADWRTVDITSPGGIYLGRRAGFEVDMPRICGVVERAVRGLYYRERKECLPKDHDVRVITNELLSEQDANVREEILQTVIRPLAAIPPKVIGRDAFSYRVHFTNRPTVSVWGLVFYNSVQFVAATGPQLLKQDSDRT
jgi:hypothetical protein